MSTTTTERLKLRNTMAEPTTGWQVRNPEDDALIKANTYHHLVLAVKEYRLARNYPVGSQFEADLQNWMCQDMPADYCTTLEPYNPETATLAQKAVRFSREIARWGSQGFPLVSAEDRNARMAACQGCAYFNAEGNLGMGQCNAPGCGCTKIKLWLETSRCNHPGGSKWP